MGRLILLCLCLYLYTGSAQETDPSDESDILDNNINASHQQMTEYQGNHKPMFSACGTYNPEVKEEQPKGTFVIKVQAIDPDPVTDESGKITYIVEEPPGTRANFKIDNVTGDVTTATSFDRDEPTRQKELYVTVRAVDNGRPQLADICNFKVTVTDINDNTPSFDQHEYATEVSEDLAESSEVMRVIAYDFDDGENARLTYSFNSGPASFEEYFKIDPSTGVIYLKQRLLGKRGQRYNSTVVVQDNGDVPNKATAEISFTVVDSNKKPPIITPSNTNITLKENESDFDLALVTVTADSNIEDKGIIFELIKGKTAQTNKDQTFKLNPTSATSAVMTLARPLDYETVTEYLLTVRAQNKDYLYTSINIVVKVEDVNDEIPVFVELLRGSVVENDVAGAQAMTVRAIDKDGTSPNNVVIYELSQDEDKELFDIDRNSGVITAKRPFDREEKSVYQIEVKASDSAPTAIFSDKSKPNSVFQRFQISIEDQNDNEPKFTKGHYEVFDISESSDKQKDVIEVKAYDKDTASSIIYSILEGNTGDAFYIENITGRIKVNNKLDFEKIEMYNLTVKAFDGKYYDTAKVTIHILNENDEIPLFEPYDKDIRIDEETPSEGCIVELTAYDPDIKDRSADQKIVYRVGDDYKSFLSVSPTGCVRLDKGLDRDPPNGSFAYQAYIYADDNDGGPNSLNGHAEINITLNDLNDNAPFLNITEIVWYENQEPGLILALTASDNDGPNNGPPFTFQIDDSGRNLIDKFEIQQNNLLHAKVVFDREEKKFYDVPIMITDSGQPPQTGVSTLRVIIGDRNDNQAKNGSSEIFVYKYEGFINAFEIGRVYVNDPDDWDLPDKVFQFNGPTYSTFSLNGSMIVMKPEASPGSFNLNFKVTESFNYNGENKKNVVYADVKVTVKEIPVEAVRKSGSIRLSKITMEEFVEKDPLTLLSKKDKLQNYISNILNTSRENVDVFTVMPSPSNSSLVDVRFSAHGSPYYAPEKLNNKATEQQENLEQELGVEFVMISINECLQSNVCINHSCSNVLSIKNEPAFVFTNKTSFVGVKAIAEAECVCQKRQVFECFNGGTAIENGLCSCREGFEGPHCENLGISFVGDGWAMYPTLDSCEVTVISLNILPQTDDGLIFYVGPLTPRHAATAKSFMSVELKDGFVVLKTDIGDGVNEVISDYKKVNDGAMHKIKINFTRVDVQIEVDECPSECLKWHMFKKSGFLKVNGPLQIGGRSNIFTGEMSKQIWGNPPSSQGFKGCITNFTYNSFVYNLGAPSDKYHAEGSCNYGMFQAATFGIDSNFLVAILVCLAILLILLLAVVVHKRKQDNLNEKDMDDTRENIINYEDEGGGECDTNFDMSVFPNVNEKPPIKDGLYKQAADVPADIGSFLDDKKRACDKDTLPCDDVRHYAYEGDGNSSGSLSSLASCTDEGDLEFNYLSSFGPRFRKLTDMYGDDPDDPDDPDDSPLL